MDNQPARPNNRTLTVVVTVLAVATEAASAVLTVPPFRWAMAPLDGPFYDVVGGFVWPLVMRPGFCPGSDLREDAEHAGTEEVQRRAA
ncbi:hypothetical protein OG738_22000 [Amycolatopsis sp. NBC_01488]|uniref:hypothetical protein n=1 Tax=Amycolatopsis sp. NBC_01488 TaxID=2903563 RepID=UPI002E2B4A38|nr:hypothetical protein [Amycolatopsis sp. NBC_01488]